MRKSKTKNSKASPLFGYDRDTGNLVEEHKTLLKPTCKK
jgi:hypothetical protein